MKKFMCSFKYAASGIQYFLQSETNGKIHACIAVITIALGYYFTCTMYEWIAISICICVVITAELFNTVIEKICNFFHPQKNQSIKIIKDMAAGAVFVSALGSACVGLIIFIPKFLNQL